MELGGEAAEFKGEGFEAREVVGAERICGKLARVDGSAGGV